MRTPLLQTKLHAPPPRPDLIPRPRVIKRLRDGPARPLTLICAPAGFGKTTSAVEWLQGKDALAPVAWLSLDENDNDPVRFLAYLLAAIQSIAPAIGATTQAMMQSPQPPPAPVLLTALINDLAAAPREFFLVLDDYHLIHTLAIHQQLEFLLEHQPPPMRVVILSREDPPLPLARLRARGLVLEIRQDDLRFTEEETVELIRRVMQIDLSRDDIVALHHRTEGWIAGLQLAGLYLRHHANAHQFVDSFAGSNRFVLDYLMEEVFAQQPIKVQEFLLQTSILERMCGALCGAITSIGAEEQGGRGEFSSAPLLPRSPAGSQQILEHLESSNLFIVPLDDERRWYRYHRLFADLLRHRLEVESRYDVAQLHAHASAWYAEQGLTSDAIHHALSARDWARAATLILGECGMMLTRGEIVTMLKWLQALPDDIVRGDPQLALNCSWALILTGQLDAAESYLKQAEAVAHAQRIAPLLGSIYAAQAQIARTRGDDPRTIQVAQKALALMPADAFMERSVVALNLGIAYMNGGRLTEAEQALGEAERTAQQSGNHHVRLIALTFLGVIQVARGRLHRGEEFFQQAIRSGGGSPAVALAHLNYGALLYEWNDLNAAAEHLQRGLEMS